MKSLKAPLILLIVYISLLFNIEIFFHETNQAFQLHRFVDALILLIVVSMLVLRFWQRIPAYLTVSIWVAVYVGLWFVTRSNSADNLLVGIVEVVFVALAVLIAREVAVRLHEVESTLDRLVFASFQGRVTSLNEAAEEIKTELLRSRRYQRALTVLVLEPDPSTLRKGMVATVEEIQHNLARRYALGKISEVISSTARRPDLVMRQEQSDRFVLLCPETTAESSGILRERIQSAVKASLGVSLSIGMASFPDDALTFEELLHKANAQLGPGGTPVAQTTVPNSVDSQNR